MTDTLPKPRRRPGPKLADPTEPVKASTYSTNAMTRRKLKAIGGGNSSRGLEVAARIAYDWWQRQP